MRCYLNISKKSSLDPGRSGKFGGHFNLRSKVEKKTFVEPRSILSDKGNGYASGWLCFFFFFFLPFPTPRWFSTYLHVGLMLQRSFRALHGRAMTDCCSQGLHISQDGPAIYLLGAFEEQG